SYPYGNLHRVIPTKVGIQNAKSQETFLPDKFPCRQTWIPACAGMTKLSIRKPAPRHSRESGNPERKISRNRFPDKFPCRRGWIPACAGMTKPSARKPAAMIQLPFAQEHHAPISNTFQENGNF
ncbi:TPA: hypothetical protein ACLBAR_002128, partial [Neisseria meningitidis]